MVTMEQYIGHSRTFATYIASGTVAAGSGKEYYDSLPKIAEGLSKLQWAVLEGGIIQLLESPNQSLGILGIIAAKAMSPELGNNFESFLSQFNQYLDQSDPNLIRLAPQLFTLTCQKFCDALIARGTPIRGINMMIQAINLTRTSPKELTGIHAILCELCIAASALKAAIPYLIDDIQEFSQELRQDCRQLLVFFYYGGIIFGGLKRYNDALFYLEACIQVPSLALSHITLEAYKKYILLSLIVKGEEPTPPKNTLSIITRILKPSAAAYTEVSNAYKTHNPVELQKIITQNMETFTRDCNVGLIKQVKTALTKLNIQRLTRTFLTLSLTDVATRCQLAGGALEAEKLVLSMIETEEIFAKINQRDGMVVFLDNKEKYASARMLQKMEDQTAMCVGLNKRLINLNERLVTNPEYVSKMTSSEEDAGISSSKISSVRTGGAFDS